MYLRFTQRRNSDGGTVRYVALAHNYRIDGRSKPQVLLNLGRVDQLDLERAAQVGRLDQQALRRG